MKDQNYNEKIGAEKNTAIELFFASKNPAFGKKAMELMGKGGEQEKVAQALPHLISYVGYASGESKLDTPIASILRAKAVETVGKKDAIIEKAKQPEFFGKEFSGFLDLMSNAVDEAKMLNAVDGAKDKGNIVIGR
jgi:hypothetical protein